MSETPTEEIIPKAVDVRLDGEFTDGIYKIDVGAEGVALVTIRFGLTYQPHLVNQLLEITKEHWESVVEQVDAAIIAADMAAEAEADKEQTL